jgi:hypothetical protein
MNQLQDNFLQDRVEAFIEDQDFGGNTSGDLSPEAVEFLGNPTSSTFRTFIGGDSSSTGTNKVVYSDNPTIKFGNDSGNVLITTTSGVVTTAAATPSATANSVVRRDASGGFSFAGGFTSSATSASISLTGANSFISVNGTISITNGNLVLTGSGSSITTSGVITGQSVVSNSHLGINSTGFIARILAPILSNNIDVTLPATSGTVLLGTTQANNFLTNPNSANLATLVSDETGSSFGGVLVFSNRPNLNGFTMPELDLGSLSGTGDLNQLSTSHRIRASVNNNVTFNMPPASNTQSASFELLLYNPTGSNNTPFFTGAKFPSGASLTVLTGRFNLYKFVSFNGQWYGIVEGAGYN